jgi:hypothetical protein
MGRKGRYDMTSRGLQRVMVLRCLGLLSWAAWASEADFTVASYNLENYLDVPIGSRPVKPEESRAKVQESLLLMRADVLAMQEVGSAGALLKLREALRRGGFPIPSLRLSPSSGPTRLGAHRVLHDQVGSRTSSS